jgi:DNA-binding transcriptional ArsR family regulator
MSNLPVAFPPRVPSSFIPNQAPTLVGRLCSGGPLSIARLTAGSDVTRQAITKHLGVLARAGIVSDIRHGRERIWKLDPDHLAEARGYLDEISIQWDRALDRLKKFVEE